MNEQEMKVLRFAHHAVVSPWRQRERELRHRAVDVTLISSKRWSEGGVNQRFHADGDSFVRTAATVGNHPSVFVFNPFPIVRALGEHPDLIDLHEEPNSLAVAEVLFLRWLKRSHVPYVLYSAQNLEKRYPLPFRWIENRALRGAAAVYVCNHEAGQILHRKGLAAPAVEMPLGVDLELFSPVERSFEGPNRVIGYVGRLERLKGVEVLLEAVAGHPQWRLDITGDGPEHGALAKKAEKLGIADRVRFRGHSAGTDLAARYQELDLIVVPSLPWPGWREQFCRVAVEAMASGVPIVASATGAIPDVVADSGILVAPGDAAALEKGIEAALQPPEWGRLRREGLARAGQFSWSTIAGLHKELYANVLDPSISQNPEVLLIAYGSPDLLAGCLDALGDRFPVTVVDNSSLPETRTVAESRGAHYVDAGSNLGFARGVNLGLVTIAERGDPTADVLLLNPDARIDESGVRRMQEELARSPRVAAVGATQMDPVDSSPVRVWWPFPTPWGAWVEAMGLGRLRRHHGFAIGSILLMRNAALRQLGPLDERFFLYAEETDWQYRAHRHGWTIAVAQVEATHEGGGTGGDPTAREAHFFGSTERYLRKHYGPAGWQAYRLATLLGALARGVVLRGERGAQARRRRDIFARGPVAAEASWE
jgi:glycosyltransferase involved in cell wall biosynthesis/GT2 family glycosyltransferase